MYYIFESTLNEQNIKLFRFPTDREDVMVEKRAFFRKCGLPNIVGAVDGTLIPIASPPLNEEVYVCRKGYHAINCQAVVAHDLR